jgi:hypothetical protein
MWMLSYRSSSPWLVIQSVSSPRTPSREEQRLPEMLDDIGKDCKPMVPPSPPSSSLGCSWRPNLLAASSTRPQTSERLRWRSALQDFAFDSTIAGSPFGYLRRSPTSDGRIRRSPSSSKCWRTEGKVPSTTPLLAAAAAIALVRRLVEASHPTLSSHHG